MSREAYQLPSTASQGAATPGAALGARFDPSSDGGATMRYICGDCGSKFGIKRAEPIRCKECGCRVLYKERTKRMVQFEAR
ncbi:metallothionein-I transcription activator [Whalleya microplaca]|nr:metallothionein-I transcription activator [Whalleya microplaca]